MDNELDTKLDIVQPYKKKSGAAIWNKINPEKIDLHHKLSPEAIKAMMRLIELTGMTQSSVIEMSLIALLVGLTNNPYYEGLVNQKETMDHIKERYPKLLDKFGFDRVRSRALRGRTPIQRAWMKDFVNKDEIYRQQGIETEDE